MYGRVNRWLVLFYRAVFLPNVHISLLIHSLGGGPQGCFQLLVILNEVTVNILVQTFVWTVISTHCSTLAWKIQWSEEPGRLQSMGSQRVGHD